MGDTGRAFTVVLVDGTTLQVDDTRLYADKYEVVVDGIAREIPWSTFVHCYRNAVDE